MRNTLEVIFEHIQNTAVFDTEQALSGAILDGKTLSQRERDTLSLLASGRNRAQVADMLKISEHTLRVYVDGARVKLGAQNTTHAVAIALSHGLIRI